MTNKQMRDQVVAWLGLQDISSFDETGMVADKLYQGTIDLLARTRCVVRCVQLRTRAGQNEYTLDHSILSLIDVENGARRRARRNQDLQPSFTLIRSDVLMVDPIPDADGQIQVWAVLRPLKMDEDTDSPGDADYGAIPDEFHDAIVTYAMWKMADYADDASAGSGEYYRVLYEGQDGRSGRLAQIRSQVNRRGTSKGPRSFVSLRATSSSGAYV